jgi:hypothetical protein
VNKTARGPAAESGVATDCFRARGLGESCNHTKEAPGWSAEPRPGPRHTLQIHTPTGHTYLSMAPPLPGDSLRGMEPAGSRLHGKGLLETTQTTNRRRRRVLLHRAKVLKLTRLTNALAV